MTSDAVTSDAVTSRGSDPLTRLRRLPDKQSHDRAVLDALLDAALVAHVVVPATGSAQAAPPVVLPTAFARHGDRVLLHGSTGSRLFRALADGAPTCASVAVVDGIVVARSQFESSMHYRSAVLFGSCRELDGEEKSAALQALADRLLPGLADQRRPNRRERSATMVLELPIDRWSLKVSTGDPEDHPDDLDLPVWAGVVPLHHTWGTPTPAPDLADGLPVPRAIAAWPGGRA